ncbi:MAG: ThuA domain-containing protein [Kiritimatiellae bacterium]|nr:ThuA domain-containing protein [Kiritimatiellia bacterium]
MKNVMKCWSEKDTGEGALNSRRNAVVLTRRTFLAEAAAGAAVAGLPLAGRADGGGMRARLEAALPLKAPVVPKRARKLLIFDLNVGYGGGHASIPVANEAFTLMGKKTGAFETTVTRDPAIFKRESLQNFDAVFLNNTVGNLFDDPALRQSLLEFVYAGGGLMGVHGTAVAFTRWQDSGKEDWPEFAVMLGTRGASHRAADEKVFMKLEEPDHPVVACFGGQGFPLQDEFFRPAGTYSRERNRVLLSFDLTKTDLSNEPHDGCYRADKDYAMAWVRQYGRGRIFHTAFGHHPAIFEDPKLLPFYLAGTQFVLGDLPAPTLPSNKLTPALRGQERLGWRLGIEAYTFHKYTFFEAIDKTAELGLAYIGALSFQKVSDTISKNFTPDLTDDELRAIRLKLDAAGLRLLTYYIQSIPGDEAGCRKIFEFGRKIGIETFMTEPAPESLPLIDRFCQEYNIHVALHNHSQKASPAYWHPDAILKVCEGRSAYIGACADTGYWLRDGIDPVAGVEKLGKRLTTLQLHDLDEAGPQGSDVPWGTGKGRVEELLLKIREVGNTPLMFGLEYSKNWLTSMPEIKQCVDFFDALTLKV